MKVLRSNDYHSQVHLHLDILSSKRRQLKSPSVEELENSFICSSFTTCTHTCTHTLTLSKSAAHAYTGWLTRPPSSSHTPVHFTTQLPKHTPGPPASLTSLFAILSGLSLSLSPSLYLSISPDARCRRGWWEQFKCVVLARASCVSKTGFLYAGKASCLLFNRRRCTLTLLWTEQSLYYRERAFISSRSVSVLGDGGCLPQVPSCF